jgi:hypothetical protein
VSPRDVTGGGGGLRKDQLLAGGRVDGLVKGPALNALGFNVQYMWLFGVAVSVYSGTILGGIGIG